MKRLLITLVLVVVPQAAVAEDAALAEEPAPFPEIVMEATPVTWEETKLAPPPPRLTVPTGEAWMGFVAGHCTRYVASQRLITFRGHARDWPQNAVRAGYTLSDTPLVGAVIVTTESRWGHVAIVRGVGDATVTFEEMNYLGRWRVSTRTLSRIDPRIRTYIL